MICLKCKSTKIDFFISSTELARKYESDGMTGKQLNKMFNPADKPVYTIKCSKCHEILKKVYPY